MPYLSVDLDGKKRMAQAARAAGVPVGEVAWGLLELWELCWAEKRDEVSLTLLQGCVGTCPALPVALTEFGFLEPVSAGFRVRGADRYLRIRQAQSEGGKAGRAKSSSKVGTGSTSGSTLKSAQALTPSTEHRAPNTKETSAAEPAAPRVWVVKPPTTPPDEWTGEDFWRWAQGRRQAGGYAPEKMPHPRQLGAWWSEVRSHCDAETLKQAFMRFGADEHWERATPPYPWAAFVNPSQLPKYLPQGAIRAASV